MSGRSGFPSFLVLASLALAFPGVSLAWIGGGLGAQPSEEDTVVLVAKPQFRDPVYGETILIARSLGDGRHVGFILNKPSNASLADAFPGRDSSGSLRERIYLGGPAAANAVFALVSSHDSPGRGSMRLSEQLYLVVAQDTVNHVARTEAQHARFFAGAVVWRPGELDEEVRRGAWYVLEADPELVLSSTTEGLWQRLVHRAELRENGI
jgi:putative transcriptional regulator